MRICGVIPIRLDSSRFPGKGLARLDGKEVILRVFEGARTYQRFNRLLVATDNAAIKDLIEANGGEVFFSDQPFRNGSERVAAAAAGLDCDICVNIQGDEVFIDAEAIAATVHLLEHRSDLDVTTLGFAVSEKAELSDTNLVKLTMDNTGVVQAFSREPISDPESDSGPENYGHIGIYAFRGTFLQKYAQLQPTASEREQSLEQLRIMEHGYRIGAALLPRPLLAINSPADLVTAEKILAGKGG